MRVSRGLICVIEKSPDLSGVTVQYIRSPAQMLQGFHERFDTRSHFKGKNCEIYKRNISNFLNSRSSFKLTFVSTLVRYFKMSVASKLFTMHRHFLCRFLYQRCSSISAPLPNRTESTNIFSLFMCTFNIF